MRRLGRELGAKIKIKHQSLIMINDNPVLNNIKIGKRNKYLQEIHYNVIIRVRYNVITCGTALCTNRTDGLIRFYLMSPRIERLSQVCTLPASL